MSAETSTHGTSHGLDESLVEIPWIAAHLDDPAVRLVEVDVSRTAYEQGHIPGAVLWNAYADLRHPDYSPIGTAELADLVATSGISPETTVVFYGYGAHLGFWLLRAHGHDPDRLRLLDGPREQWQTAGNSWSTETPAPLRTSYALLDTDPELFVSRETVEGMVGRPDEILLDVRAQVEYDGDYFWPSGATEGAGRAGHLPGSAHVPIDRLRSDDGRFKEPEELRRALAESGVTPGGRIVVYCTVGNRASQAWFALTELLGYPDVGVYYGSWSEWGTRSDTPVEVGGRLV